MRPFTSRPVASTTVTVWPSRTSNRSSLNECATPCPNAGAAPIDHAAMSRTARQWIRMTASGWHQARTVPRGRLRPAVIADAAPAHLMAIPHLWGE